MRVWSMWQTPGFPAAAQFSFFFIGATQATTGTFAFPTASAQARLLTRAFRWHLEVDATQALVTVHSAPPDSPNMGGDYVWSVSAGHPFDDTTQLGFAFVGPSVESVGWPYMFLLDAHLWPDWAPKDHQLLDLMASAGAARRWVHPPPRSAPDSTRLDFPGALPPPLPFDERAAPFFHAHDDLYVRPGDYHSFVGGLDERYRRRAISQVEVSDFETNYFDPRYLRGDFSILNGVVDWTTPDGRYDQRYLGSDFSILNGTVDWTTPDKRYSVASLDVIGVNPPFALLTLASLPALVARLATLGVIPSAATIARVKISITAAEVVTLTGAPVKAYAAYAGPTQWNGVTFRWPILVGDAPAGTAVAAVGAGNQLSLTVTAYVT